MLCNVFTLTFQTNWLMLQSSVLKFYLIEVITYATILE